MKHIPLEDFFKDSPKAGFQLSPDGKHLSFLAPVNGCMNVFVQSLEDENQEEKQLTFVEDRNLHGYYWNDNQRLLFMKDTNGDENFHLYGVNIDGSDLRCYTPFDGVRITIIDDLEDQPDEIIIGMNQRNPEVFDPYRLNLQTGELTQLAENPGNWQGWLTDNNGALRSVTAVVDGVNTQILYRDNEDEDFRPVLTTNFKTSVNFFMFTADNRYVYAATNMGRDKLALVLMDPATCEEVEVLYENPTYDISNISYSRKRKKLLGVFCTAHCEPVRHYFEEEEEQFMRKIRAFFPGMQCGLADNDKAEENYLIYVGNDNYRGAYYFYNIHDEAPRLVRELAPWLEAKDLGRCFPFTYETRDQLTVEAYLYLPNGYKIDDPQRLPMVVNPHGGPWARDYYGYSSEAQFLANRGYAVLRMNFRGSTGYGRHFLEQSYKQWGKKMQDDITDGVKYLIKKGWADEKRIAIYGASYGGYATLAGLAFTPDLYKCGIDYCGVSNLFTFMNTIPPYWRPMLEMMYEQVGNPETEQELLAAASPALHANKIVAPLFIAQGAKDPRVNKDESDQMVEALRKQGVEVEYMVKDNEGHGFSSEENRFDFYRAMEKFLAQYL